MSFSSMPRFLREVMRLETFCSFCCLAVSMLSFLVSMLAEILATFGVTCVLPSAFIDIVSSVFVAQGFAIRMPAAISSTTNGQRMFEVGLKVTCF